MSCINIKVSRINPIKFIVSANPVCGVHLNYIPLFVDEGPLFIGIDNYSYLYVKR